MPPADNPKKKKVTVVREIRITRTTIDARSAAKEQRAAVVPNPSADSALLQAVADGDLGRVDNLLSADSELANSARNERGATALHLALENAQMVGLLVGKGANVEAQDEDGETPLHWAARKGLDDSLRILLCEGNADVSARDREGETPLHEAALYGQSGAARLLLGRGADVEARNARGRTVEQYALLASGEPNEQMLTALGRTNKGERGKATIKHKSIIVYSGGKSETMLASSSAAANPSDAEPLVVRGGVTSTGRRSIRSMFALGKGSPSDETLKIGDESSSEADRRRSSPFAVPCCLICLLYVVILLLLLLVPTYHLIRYLRAEQPQQPTAAAVGPVETAAVQVASPYGHSETERGGGDGPVRHSLHEALRGNSRQQVLRLLKSGADVNAVDEEEGRGPALHVALQLHNRPMVRLIPLFGLIRPFEAELLIENGASVEALDGAGMTPLQVAASQNQIGLMRLFLSNRANVHAAQNGTGKNALHFAAEKGRIAAISELLGNGANIGEEDGRGWTALQYAVMNGHENTALFLLEHWEGLQQAQILAVFDLLGAAAGSDERVPSLEAKWTESLRIFLASHWHDEDPRRKKWLLLNEVRQGNAQNVLAFYDHYADLALNWTEDALLLAVWFNRFDLVQLLLRKVDGGSGAEKALHWAALAGRERIAQMLLREASANSTWRNADGQMALHLAVDEQARRGTADRLKQMAVLAELVAERGPQPAGEMFPYPDETQTVAVLKTLLEAGGGKAVTERDGRGMTALDYAAKNGMARAVQLLLKYASAGELESALRLVEGNSQIGGLLRGAEAQLAAQSESLQKIKSLNAWNIRGQFSVGGELLKAAKHGRTELVGELLGKGVDVNLTRNAYGNTALHLASTFGHSHTVRLLLERGASVEAANSKGQVPLFYAACEGKERVARLLIDAGADVNWAGAEGDTALHCAAEEGWEAVEKLLIKVPIHNPLISGLAQSGARVDAQNGQGLTALHRAAQFGKVGAVGVLLAEGADPNARSRRVELTPLHLAAQEGHEGAAQLLLERGADATRRDRHGWTPLHYAVKYGKRRCTQLLLEHLRDKLTEGEYAQLLALADSENCDRIRELLIERLDPHPKPP